MSASSLHSPTATLLRLAWPIVLARATQAVVGFSDAFMVAPLGEAPLAAVTTGAMDVLCLIMLPLGTMFILQSFAAQLRGKGDLVAVGRYAHYGLFLSGLAGVVGLCIVPLIGFGLGLIGYEPAVERDMEAYISVRLYSVAALVGTEALGNWYGGLGNTRMALVASVLTMVSNVFLNWLLIEPRWGLPGYGAEGAAWASAMATVTGFVLLLVCFSNRVGHDVPKAPLDFRWPEFGRMLRFGLPSGINYFLEFAAFALFINVVVGHLGTTTLAAFNVVFQLNMLSFMPAFGVASAGAILVGEAIGRGQPERVRGLTWLALRFAGGWMLAVGILYILSPAPFIQLFAPADMPAGELMQVGTLMLGLSGVWQLFDAISMTLTESLRAAGDTAWPMAARIFLAWCVFTPGAWLAVLVFDGGPTAVMLSVIVYLFVLAAVLAYRFQSGAWRRISLVGPTEPAPTVPEPSLSR
jgi:MATE family multidrug resistance protein